MGEDCGSIGQHHPPGNARNGGSDSPGEVVLGWFSAAVPGGKGTDRGARGLQLRPALRAGGRRALTVAGELGVCSRNKLETAGAGSVLPREPALLEKSGAPG